MCPILVLGWEGEQRYCQLALYRALPENGAARSLPVS